MTKLGWAIPEHSRTVVDRAGETLIDPSASEERRAEALRIISNWRSSHGFPLNTFQMVLRERALRVDKSRTIAQRLKRLPSIQRKLRRFKGMRLTQVQDVGGCRAVVAAVSQVERLAQVYRAQPLAHALVSWDDYIDHPEPSGYRAVHLIHRYQSRVNDKYSRLLVEIQIRSRLQHVWAAAVETVDTFQSQELKFGGGEAPWKRFFALMGSVMALKEGTALVPETPTDSEALLTELRDLIDTLDVRRRLQQYEMAVEATQDAEGRQSKWFLLTLEPGPPPAQHTLTITGFGEGAESRATEAYSREEERVASRSGAEVVLASVPSLRSLIRAYPNYYLDTHAFLDSMRDVTGR